MKVLEPKEEINQSQTQFLPEHLAEYAETFVRLAAVKSTRKATQLTAATLTAVLLCVFLLFVLLFLALGLAIWIGESWDNMKAGYFIVSGGILICTLPLFFLRKKVILPFIRTYIIRKAYE